MIRSVGLGSKLVNSLVTLALTFASMGLHISRLGPCQTSTVRITLAAEQVEFCSPTSLPYHVDEDDLTAPGAGYAGLTQLVGYGMLDVRAVSTGSLPGGGFPPYDSSIEEYRQTILRPDNSDPYAGVSTAPSASMWGRSFSGIQVDSTLASSTDDIPIRTVEWFAGHNGRLWIIRLAWDVSMENAAEWEQASRHFSIWNAVGAGLPDTATDLGVDFKVDASMPPGMLSSSLADVPAPPWWSGVCDDNNYSTDTDLNPSGLHSFPLGDPWRGLVACGPFSFWVPHSNHFVRFAPGLWGQYEFECVELVMRYFYLEFGIPPWRGDAGTIKDYRPADLVDFYPNGSSHAMVPGDIITEGVEGNGHAILVIGTNLDAAGTGTIRIMEQNSILGGQRDISVVGWTVVDTWTSKPVQGWLHARANTPNGTGDPDPAFSTDPGWLDLPINAMGLQSTKKIIIAGDFTTFSEAVAKHIARLNIDGTLDTSFITGNGISSEIGQPVVSALQVQADDKILVGGSFDGYNGITIRNVARLGVDAALDTGFTPPLMTAAAGSSSVNAIAVQPDGKVLIGGNFTTLDAVSHGNIARLNSNGAVDAGFSPSVNGIVYTLALQGDGRILVGGAFTGSTRNGIVRLNTNGALDSTFNPVGIGPAGTSVRSIAIQGDGKILVAGDYGSYNGTPRSMIARLNSDGSLDTTFNPGTGVSGTNAIVKSVVPQPDGRILIAGKFSKYNNATFYNLIRLNYDGSRDGTFLAHGDFTVSDDQRIINAMLLQQDGKILLGGDFFTKIARLLNHVENCYSLGVTVSPMEGGEVEVNTPPNCPVGKFISGTTVSLSAIPNPDPDLEYQFINWSGGATGTNPDLFLAMDADKTATANFLRPPGPFSKVSPLSGMTVEFTSITLSWNASERAASYEYCLTTILPPICDTNDNEDAWKSAGASTSVTLPYLMPDTTFYWNVRARNAADTTHGGDSWSLNTLPAPYGLCLPLVRR